MPQAPSPTAPPPPPGPVRRGCFALLALGLGLALGLALVEIGARVVFRNQPPSVFSMRSVVFQPSEDPRAVFEYRPGSTFGSAAGRRYRINSLGLRGPETTVAKPPGTFRIVTLGDSYTFGESVAAGEIWPRRLEKMLQRRTGRAIEVLNFGVQAYNTRNALGLFEHRALAFDPDLVILAHLVNDDLWSYIRVVRGTMVLHFEEDPDGRIPLSPAVKQWLYGHSLAYRLGSVSYLGWRKERDHRAQDPSSRRSQPTQAALDGWQDDGDGIDARSIRELHRLCAERGIPLVLADFPVTQDGPVRFRGPAGQLVTDNLRALADELGATYIDLFPALKGLDGSQFRVAPHDHHPNGELHARYAGRLRDRLLQSGLLRAP